MQPIHEAEWIPISALNHFEFCPRRCYYIHIEQLFVENVFTLMGHENHKKVHEDHVETTSTKEIHYQMYLFSRRDGLYGQGDKIEVSSSRLTPIEYKTGGKKRWRNDRLQLCAQALCLEEMFSLPVERGYLFYQKNRRREEVLFDERLREQTREAIAKVRALFKSKERPPNIPHKRCEGCSFEPVCLPKETQLLLQESPQEAEKGRL